MFRSFWGGFFLFLSVLVGLAFVMRPDTVDNVLTYFGWLGLGIGFAILGLVYLVPVCGVVAFGVWLHFYIKERRVNLMRQQNGSYPLQKLDPRKRYVFYDPNQQVAPVVTIDPDAGVIEHNGGVPWEFQLATAQRRALVANTQAAMPSDDALVRAAKHISNGVGGGGLMRALRPGAAEQKALTQMPKGWDDEPQRAKMPAQLPPPVSVPAPVTVSDMSLGEALRASSRDRLVFGYAPDGGDVATWDVTETPMMRIHGGTQKGKTSAALAIVAAALAQAMQVVIIDNRGFKNWHVAGPWAELIDARQPQELVTALTSVHNEFQRREELLHRYQARDITQLRGSERPPRLLVVVEEYGAQRVRAKALGCLDELDEHMSVLTSMAGADGIHILAIDQRPKDYNSFVKANLGAVVVFGMPDEGAAKAAGYARAHQLRKYEFAFEGVIYRSVDAARTFQQDVGAASPVTYPKVIDVQPSVRSVGVRSAFSPEVDVSQQAQRTPQNDAYEAPAESGPTDLQAWIWQWRDTYPTGTQAQLRASLEAAGVNVARSWVHNCYHDWGKERLAQFERGELNEAQTQALFNAGLLDVRGGPTPGAQRVERDYDANE